MTSLTVVTFTRSLKSPYLGRCQESVEKALLPGMKHKIIVCSDPKDFVRMRYESLLIDDYVAVVDDDDLIDEHTLSDCSSAIQKHNLDLVFTDENLVYENTGSVSQSRRGKRSYLGVASSPSEIHNLFVIKGERIVPRTLGMALRFDSGVEWIIKASVALTGNVGHIQKPHYQWTQRADSRSKGYRDQFNKIHVSIRDIINETWPTPKGFIPVVG